MARIRRAEISAEKGMGTETEETGELERMKKQIKKKVKMRRLTKSLSTKINENKSFEDMCLLRQIRRNIHSKRVNVSLVFRRL